RRQAGSRCTRQTPRCVGLQGAGSRLGACRDRCLLRPPLLRQSARTVRNMKRVGPITGEPSMKKNALSMSRRDVLRIAGSVALFLPALEACGRAGGTASAERLGGASQRLGVTAKRLLSLKIPDGTVPDAWFPTGTESSFQLGQILQPLEAHKSNMIVMK